MVPSQPRRVALVLSRRYAEVFAPGMPDGELHRRSFEGTEDPEVLAENAKQALTELGERRRRVVLLLEDGLARSLELKLPPVPDSELRSVIERQLDRDLESPQHFLAESAQGAAENGELWRVSCVPKDFHRELLSALRHEGIEVMATHSLDHTLLASSRARLDPGQVGACVLFGNDRVLVGLQNATSTLRLSALPLRQDHDPASLAIGLTQELRNVAAFWRKASRGSELDTWWSLGGTDAQVEALRSGALTALGGLPGEHLGAEAPRETVLRSALGRSARDLDLAPGLEPRRSRVAALSVLVSTVLVGFLAVQLPGWRTRVQENRERLEVAAAEDLEWARLSHARSQLESARSRFEGEMARMSSLNQRGLNLGEFVFRVSQAFEGRAALLGIDAGQGSDGREVHLSATLPQIGVIDVQALQALRADLEALPFLESVRVDLANQLPSERGTSPQALEVRGRLTEVQS